MSLTQKLGKLAVFVQALIKKRLTQKEMRLYLREIKKDITYFRKTFDRADMQVDISGLDAEESAEKVERSLEAVLKK